MIRAFLAGFLLLASIRGFAAERIVSLSPNLTEMVVLLGAQSMLVGRSTACDYPESVKKLPAIGGFGSPNLEALTALSPTLVITETLKNPADRAAFQRLGIRFEELPAADFADYRRNLERLGELLDCKAEARRESARVAAKVEKWEKENLSLSELKRPKVLIVLAAAPIITAGKRSFLTRFVELARGENIAQDEDKSYFSCSPEWIALRSPDVILAPGMGTEQLRAIQESPGWAELPAVRNRRIIVDFNPDLVYRLGPRSLDGIEELRQYLRSCPVK